MPTGLVTGKELTFILLAYFLGCFTSGYYWVRWRSGIDLRHEGSGTLGARNAGRLLGSAGFTVTLLLDVTKGALAVTLASYFGLRPEAIIAVIVAVVAGHIWPIQLRFHGGKGIATSLGALFAYDALIIAILALVFLPLLALFRNFTLNGLLAFSLLPLAVFVCGLGNTAVAATSFLAIIILIAHRKNIREEFARIFPDRRLKESANKDRIS